jgi:hypothetical protein
MVQGVARRDDSDFRSVFSYEGWSVMYWSQWLEDERVSTTLKHEHRRRRPVQGAQWYSMRPRDPPVRCSRF